MLLRPSTVKYVSKYFKKRKKEISHKIYHSICLRTGLRIHLTSIYAKLYSPRYSHLPLYQSWAFTEGLMLKLNLLMRRADSLKRPWCWERLRAGGEGDDRGWDGWIGSLTQWTWVWVDSRSWWWTGRPGVLRFMGSQRVGHDWATELNWRTTSYTWIWGQNTHKKFQIWDIIHLNLLASSMVHVLKGAWTRISEARSNNLKFTYLDPWHQFHPVTSEQKAPRSRGKARGVKHQVCSPAVSELHRPTHGTAYLTDMPHPLG